jgi:hypothetical protein
MEKACGNSACRNTFICHNDKKKFCSNRCYPSVIARAAAKQASRNGALAGATNCASLDTVRTTPAHTPAPTYYETPDDTSTRRTRDDSWIPSPHSGCSPPTARFGRPRRDPAPSANFPLAGIDAPHPALFPSHARPQPTPPATRRAPAPPTINLRSHQGPVVPYQPISSPHSPLGTSPTTNSGASSPSLELGVDDLDGSLPDEEDGPTPANLFYEHWAPIIMECSSRTELDTIASDLAADWHSALRKTTHLTVRPLDLLVLLVRHLKGPTRIGTSPGNNSESVRRTMPSDGRRPANSKHSSKDTRRGPYARFWARHRSATLAPSSPPHSSSRPPMSSLALRKRTLW